MCSLSELRFVVKAWNFHADKSQRRNKLFADQSSELPAPIRTDPAISAPLSLWSQNSKQPLQHVRGRPVAVVLQLIAWPSRPKSTPAAPPARSQPMSVTHRSCARPDFTISTCFLECSDGSVLCAATDRHGAHRQPFSH